jgi:(E)-4-hydroxy-3-methylbut-2-enyl-diphosphate synthase
VVKVGKLLIGGENPILIQSMLSSNTTDVDSCYREILSLHAVGCQLIRLSIPAHKDLEAIPKLRTMMREEGINIPLVADIHFLPKLALEACELFEKVRINPGNYCDIPKNSRKQLSGISFEEGYQQLKEALVPLTRKLKERKVALRIGVNHGSLSARMIEQYGDSPLGMVKSALETAKILEEFGYNNFVISLKSSNPIIVQKAYRLLIEEQGSELKIPLHLGVTETGNGLMARIKSLAGIGSLLADGIGDTIRVSLTEPSANEIVFARDILENLKTEQETTNPVKYWRRPLNHQRIHNKKIVLQEKQSGEGRPLQIGTISTIDLPDTGIPLEPDFTVDFNQGNLILDSSSEVVEPIRAKELKRLTGQFRNQLILLAECKAKFELRDYYSRLDGNQSAPVGLLLSASTLELAGEIELATILSEGLIDFLIIPEKCNPQHLKRISLLLQATRSKTLITDFIACPSCGRTLFDLENTTKKIKEKTSHLPGLKIGIMGCIVNGPGEMADADFGYVGSGRDKIDLYYGQQLVRRGLGENEAVGALVELIKEKEMWQDPPLSLQSPI